jgi:hypothetical protein
LRDALDTQVSGGALRLTAGLSGLGRADPASIRVLLDAHAALASRGGTLELAFPQPAVATGQG